MTIAEQLREEMAQSVVFDRYKVIEAVKNGIRHNGVAYVTYYGFGYTQGIYEFAYTQGIIYRSTEVEVSSNAECEAIKRFLTDNGFRCAVYHHPASGRPIGYKVML